MELRILPKIRKIPKNPSKTFVLFSYELQDKIAGTFEEKEAETLELIKNHLIEFKKCFVVSSHGKDSIVMVHLIWRACKDLKIPMIEVWLNHTLNVYIEEKAYWDLFNKKYGIEDKFRVFYPPKDEKGKNQTVWTIAEKVGHLPNFRATYKKAKGYKHGNTPECCDILKKASVNKYLKGIAKDERYDCHFVGTRAEESQIRRLGVLQRCRSYLTKYRKPYPIRTVTPLSFWKAVDVLEYFHRYDIPKNPTYDVHNLQRMGCSSCPAHIGWEARLARDPTTIGYGMLKRNLAILQKTEPERFDNAIKALVKWVHSDEAKDATEDRRDQIYSLINKAHHQEVLA